MDHHNHMSLTTVKQVETTAHIHEHGMIMDTQGNDGGMNHMMMMSVRIIFFTFAHLILTNFKF